MDSKRLDIMVPVRLDPQTDTCDSIAKQIKYQHENYGFKRFAFFALSKGWRSIGYPPREHYIECANLAAEVKKQLASCDVECGWFLALTLKSGASEEFTSPVKADGTKHPFSSCPLDPGFRKRFAEDVALFAKIVKPAFIFTEDDFSIEAVSGCFCEHHLKEFAARQGRYYSREELTAIFAQKTPASYRLLREWRELAKDSLVGFAQAMRTELDKESPEIPMGYMQSGGADYDGDATEAIARALAGPDHTPFSRLFGTFYCGVDVKRIPEELYHPLYSKQHIREPFRFYHESDAYPHTKFYTAGVHMKAIMGTAYAYGFDGSVFFTGQIEGESGKGSVYGEMYAEEDKRFNEVYRIAKQCELKGVEIEYDPFWNTADEAYSTINPLWVRSIGRFGIPFTSLTSQVAFWDVRQAKYAEHDTIMDRLSKGLILDGEAAKCLCERGYGRYLGVAVGEDVITGTNLIYDLGAHEEICEPFATEGKPRRMPAAHMFSPPGNGKWLELTVTDSGCEVVTEAYTFQKKLITPAMTRFENELGGRIVVMSLTLDGNNSQALFNYERQRLLQELVVWCSDEYVLAKEAPDVFVIANEAKNSGQEDFIGMLTLINLCEDPLKQVELHLPPHWKQAGDWCILQQNGEWQDVAYTETDDGIVIHCELRYCEPVSVLAVK